MSKELVAHWMERNTLLSDKLDRAEEKVIEQAHLIVKQAEEIDRLRYVIEVEAEKWEYHHADQAKKEYWRAFARKAKP